MTSRDGGNAGNAGAVGSADSFIYGENNRLKEAGLGGSPLATYTYNGRGERVKKLGAATTYYYYDSNGQLIAELDGSGNTVREYVYLDGQPLALITNNNIYTMHTDHLGTPQVITDNAQVIVWQADYKPFGEATMTTELVTNNLRFPGQYFDSETGLHYNYFRDYDPSTGRYIESDPIGLYGGSNTYTYANLNPIVNYDQFGLLSWSDSVSINTVGSLSGGLGGSTDFTSNISCKCSCSGGGYKLAECMVNISITVLLAQGGTGGCSQRWYGDRENEHVSDIQAAYASLKKSAASLEDEMKSTTYDNKETCESVTTAEMIALVNGGLGNARDRSRAQRDRPQPDPGRNLMDRYDHHSCAEALRRGTAY